MLKKALVDLEDPVYGIGYVIVVVLSLVMYYMACLVDPGYVQKQKVILCNICEFFFILHDLFCGIRIC